MGDRGATRAKVVNLYLSDDYSKPSSGPGTRISQCFTLKRLLAPVIFTHVRSSKNDRQ